MNSDAGSQKNGLRPYFRWPGFLWLALFLLWLPLEDTKTIIPIILATYLILWIIIAKFILARESWKISYFAILGVLGTSLLPIVASFLMLFKSGVHSHGFSEYSPNQFVDLLSAIPLAAASGLIIGIGTYWVLTSSKEKKTSQRSNG